MEAAAKVLQEPYLLHYFVEVASRAARRSEGAPPFQVHSASEAEVACAVVVEVVMLSAEGLVAVVPAEVGRVVRVAPADSVEALSAEQRLGVRAAPAQAEAVRVVAVVVEGPAVAVEALSAEQLGLVNRAAPAQAEVARVAAAVEALSVEQEGLGVRAAPAQAQVGCVVAVAVEGLLAGGLRVVLAETVVEALAAEELEALITPAEVARAVAVVEEPAGGRPEGDCVPVLAFA